MKQKGLRYAQAHAIANAEIPLINSREQKKPSKEQIAKQPENQPLPTINGGGSGNGPKKPDDKDKKTAKMPDSDDRLGHIFKNDNGHLPRTPENYKLIEELIENPQNYLGPDARGNHWWAKTLENGEQIWAQAYNGIVRNGGLNKAPRPFHPQTGLSRFIGTTNLGNKPNV